MRKLAKQTTSRQSNTFSLLKCQIASCIVSHVKNQSSKLLCHLGLWTGNNKERCEDTVNKPEITLSHCFPQTSDSDSQQIYRGMVNLISLAHIKQTFKYFYLQLLKWYPAAEYFVMQQFQEDCLVLRKLLGYFQGFYGIKISLKQTGGKSIATRSCWCGGLHSVLDNVSQH